MSKKKLMKALEWHKKNVESLQGHLKEIEEEEKFQKEIERREAEEELLKLCYDEGDVVLCYNVDEDKFTEWKNNRPYGVDATSLMITPYRFKTCMNAHMAILKLGLEKLKLIFRID